MKWDENGVNGLRVGESSGNGVCRLKVLLRSVRDTIRRTQFAEDAVVVRSTFRRAVVVLAVTPMLR